MEIRELKFSTYKYIHMDINTQYQNLVIDTPNPFTTRPLPTQYKTNELILEDPNMRIMAHVAPIDLGLYDSSKIISSMHLQPGWQWR
jgi:hypothetical protein